MFEELTTETTFVLCESRDVLTFWTFAERERGGREMRGLQLLSKFFPNTAFFCHLVTSPPSYPTLERTCHELVSESFEWDSLSLYSNNHNRNISFNWLMSEMVLKRADCCEIRRRTCVTSCSSWRRLGVIKYIYSNVKSRLASCDVFPALLCSSEAPVVLL